MMPYNGADDAFNIALAELEQELGQAPMPQADPGMTQGMPVPQRNPQFMPQPAPQPVAQQPVSEPIPVDEAPNYDEIFIDKDIVPPGSAPMDPLSARALYYTNALTMNAWPYIAAGLRQWRGADGELDFETLRRQEQNRVRQAGEYLGETEREVGPYIVPAAGTGALMRTAKNARQLGKRSMAGGGTYGTVSGYLGQTEPDTLDLSARIPNALVGGLTGAALGYAGGRTAGEVASRLPRVRERMIRMPRQRKQQGGGMSATDRRLSIERGREAVEGAPIMPGLVEGAPYRKITDLPEPLRRQLMEREMPLFNERYGERSREWRRHVRQTIADAENARKRALEIEGRLNREGVPEFSNVQEKIAVIMGMYQGGRSLNQIASALGETGEQVAQTLLRAPQTLGNRGWNIEVAGQMPEGRAGQFAAGILRSLTQSNTDLIKVPAAQVRSVLDDAGNLMRDIEAYRRSGAQQPRTQNAPPLDRGPVQTPPASPPPPTQQPTGQRALPPTQPETPAPKTQTRKKPATKAKPKKPAAADKLTRRERTIARERYVRFLDETGRKRPTNIMDLTQDQLLHGWRMHTADVNEALRFGRTGRKSASTGEIMTPSKRGRQKPRRGKQQRSENLTQDERIKRQAQDIPESEKEAARDTYIEWYAQQNNGRQPKQITDRDMVFGHTLYLVNRDQARRNYRGGK